MDSRERTFLALSFQQPDRVPIDLWLSNGSWHKLESTRHLGREAFLDLHDVDLRYIEGPRYVGPPLRPWPTTGCAGQTELQDIWGVRRRSVEVRLRDAAGAEGVEHYLEVSASPLASATSVEEIEQYDHWPSPDWFDYSDIETQCEAIRRRGRVVVFMGDRLNRIAQLKPAMYLRGIEHILLDMSLNPDVARAILCRIRRFYLAYAERIYEAAHGKLDLVLTGDDFGTQNGPLLSPAMWSDYLAPGFAEYIALAKSYGLRVMHHTCGSVRALIPLMIRCGLDILQSLQPEASDMDPRQLKADYGQRLAFQGGLSIQRTLPFGTPAEVREQVRLCIEALAPGGGYILGAAHNIQADVSLDNLDAMLQAHHDYGVYR